MGKFLNVDLIYLIDVGLFRYSISSHISFGMFLFPRNLSISSTFSKQSFSNYPLFNVYRIHNALLFFILDIG